MYIEEVEKFTVYDCEAETVLEVLEDLADYTNKIPYRDHKGSWQGLDRPTMSEEGMRATVEQLIEETIPSIDDELSTINQFKNITSTAQPINILYLGGKNDGSEDVGALINEYTEQFPIYLPCGIYKVTTPIILKNSLIGGGFSRNQTVTNNHTWLISELEDGSLITIPTYKATESLTIKNISIKLNGLENGIEYAASNLNLVSIKNISIINLSGIGIFLNATSGVTRAIYADNVTILGKAYQSSTGIYVSDKCYDSRFTNIEIMGTKIGIDSNELISGGNLHIWTGSMSGEDTQDWWGGTVGIRSTRKSIVRFSNAYLDSCFIPFVCIDDGRITIDNLLYWEDTSMKGSSRYDGSLAWCSNCTNPDNITINGGLINLGERLNYISNKHTQKNNVKYITNKTLTADNLEAFPFYDKDVLYEGTATGESTVYYQHVATVFVQSHGVCKFNITLNGGQSVDVTVTKKYDNDTAIITDKINSVNHELYYKQNGNFYKIFIKVGSTHNYQIRLLHSFGVRLLNVGALLNTDRTKYSLSEKVSDVSTLTEIITSS